MVVDTAKIIFAAFPDQARIVVGGIPAKYQTAMQEMNLSIARNEAAVLFPTDQAPTVKQLFRENDITTSSLPRSIILIDGTWVQARRLYKRYVANCATVQLSSVGLGVEGRQLRPHPIPVREIATAHALGLFLQEAGWASQETVDCFQMYQVVAKEAARRQLRRERGT